MKQVRIGIIGTGNIAATAHAPAIAAIPEATLVAVLSRDQITGSDFLQKHGDGGGDAYTTLENFVADPNIDLVIICSPDRLHFEQAKACLLAGKHVLLEKPLTTSESEAAELVQIAQDKELVLAVGFHLRSHVGHRLLFEAVRGGAIGKLRHVRTIWAFPQKHDSNWRAKGELTNWWSLSAVGSHCIDLVRWFAQDQDDWGQFSTTIANNVWHGPNDETAVVTAQLASGPTVEVVSSVQFGPFNRIELFGDRGSVICEGTMGREGAGTISINGQSLAFDPVVPFVEQLHDIIHCIETSKTPRAGGEVGLRSVKDLFAATQTGN